MAFEHNDIATKSGLRAGLGESEMGFEHNDIVTVDVMNAAIAAGGGGGGGDDYSIAHVTFTKTTNNTFSVCVPNLYNDVMYSDLTPNDITGDAVDVVMYKGQALVVCLSSQGVSIRAVTGNITESGGVATVTGDGSITIGEG